MRARLASPGRAPRPVQLRRGADSVQLQGRGRGRARRPGCGCREAPGAGARRRRRGSGRRAASCDFSFVVAATRVCFLGRCGRCFPAAPALCPAPSSPWFHPSSFPEVLYAPRTAGRFASPLPPLNLTHTHPGTLPPPLKNKPPNLTEPPRVRGSGGRVDPWSGCLRAIAVLGTH